MSRRAPSPPLSGVRGMWVMALFDLPVDTPDNRKEYTRFRKALLELGFTMLQFSVYARYCSDDDVASTFRKRIRQVLPPGGQVRVVSITDVQYGKMEIYQERKRGPPESAPSQLMLF